MCPIKSPFFFQEAFRTAVWWRGSDWKTINNHDSSSCGATSQLLGHYGQPEEWARVMGVERQGSYLGSHLSNDTLTLIWFPRCNVRDKLIKNIPPLKRWCGITKILSHTHMTVQYFVEDEINNPGNTFHITKTQKVLVTDSTSVGFLIIGRIYILWSKII